VRTVKKENVKVLVLTEKDRRLLESIDKSLKDIKKGRVKEFLVKKLKSR
jgi:hypothetical protein